MTTRSLLYKLLLKRDNRFLILLISLVLFFSAYPIAEGTFWAKSILNFFLLLILVAGVYAIAESRVPFLISLALALFVLFFRWGNYSVQSDLNALMEYCFSALFWAYIAASMLKFVLSQRVVTTELIYGALAIYFIFGLAWASIYQFLEIMHPGSFSLPDYKTSDQSFIFQMWYFSMVTLTTLGYGDISPVTMSARVFVVMEAILGQFYLAVLVASLIGKGIAQRVK